MTDNPININNPMWNLEQGVYLVRLVETALVAHNLYAHCALGGSVIHKGESFKDLDIMIYQHDSTNKRPYNRHDIDQILKKSLGFILDESWIHERRFCPSGESMIEDNEFRVSVYICHGKRIDVFFL